MNFSFIRFFSTPLFYILLINLVLKVFVFGYVYRDQNLISDKLAVKGLYANDEPIYHYLALNLIEYHSFTSPINTFPDNSLLERADILSNHSDINRVPVYPAYLAIVYEIFGVRPYIAIFLQILLSLISNILIYRICMLLFNNKIIATIASLLFAIDIYSIFVSTLLLTDTLCLLLQLAAVFYIVKITMEKKIIYLLKGTVFVSLACLSRPSMMFFPFLPLLIILFFCNYGKLWKLKYVAIYCGVLITTVGLWPLRNYYLYGHFAMSVQGEVSYLMYSAVGTEANLTGKNEDSIKVQFQKQAEILGFNANGDMFENAKIYRKVFYSYFMNHKELFIRSQLVGELHMFTSISSFALADAFGWLGNSYQDIHLREFSAERILHNFSSIKIAILSIILIIMLSIQYIGCILGLLSVFKNKNYLYITIFFFTVFYFTIITGNESNFRYKLPIIPFICILAGNGYYYASIRNIFHKKI